MSVIKAYSIFFFNLQLHTSWELIITKDLNRGLFLKKIKDTRSYDFAW